VSLKWNIFLHALGGVLAVGAVATNILPPDQKAIAVGVIAGAKLIVGAVAQHFNTDGTAQESPFIAKPAAH
jgi:hypothetical protein